jgi:hypothetical protein
VPDAGAGDSEAQSVLACCVRGKVTSAGRSGLDPCGVVAEPPDRAAVEGGQPGEGAGYPRRVDAATELRSADKLVEAVERRELGDRLQSVRCVVVAGAARVVQAARAWAAISPAYASASGMGGPTTRSP